MNLGTIVGQTAVVIARPYTTIDNSGYIKGAAYGVYGNFPTISVTNEAQGTIVGNDAGIYLHETSDATLVDAGTIVGVLESV